MLWGYNYRFPSSSIFVNPLTMIYWQQIEIMKTDNQVQKSRLIRVKAYLTNGNSLHIALLLFVCFRISTF